MEGRGSSCRKRVIQDEVVRFSFGLLGMQGVKLSDW